MIEKKRKKKKEQTVSGCLLQFLEWDSNLGLSDIKRDSHLLKTNKPAWCQFWIRVEQSFKLDGKTLMMKKIK